MTSSENVPLAMVPQGKTCSMLRLSMGRLHGCLLR